MTTPIHIRARDPDNGRRLVLELLDLGIPRERLRVYGRRIPAGLPVQAIRWHGTGAAAVPAAVAGAVALPALAAALLPVIGRWTVALLALLGAVIGAGWWQYRSNRRFAPVAAQQEALHHGDLLIVADVEPSALERVESFVAERHPEVLLLGPDAGGSPPFP
jgi:hypothetical protein